MNLLTPLLIAAHSKKILPPELTESTYIEAGFVETGYVE